jgi:hypothetical protein
MGAGEGGVKAIKHKYFNIGGTSDAIIKKAAMTKAGTMATLNADEVLKTGDAGIIASYRQSSLTQIVKSSATPTEDSIFINQIEKIYNSYKGAGSYKEAFNQISSQLDDRGMAPMTSMEFAIRVTGNTFKNSIKEGLEEITMRSCDSI